jgi:predicted PurR-regulated permease PerM
MIKNLAASLQDISSTNDSALTVIIIVGCILVCLALFAVFYMIVAYRRISIVARKVDYLVEDLTYKTEMLTPTIEALVKLSNYIDLLESFVNQNSSSLMRYISNNSEASFKLVDKLKDLSKGK